MKRSLLTFSILIILSILFYPQAEVISNTTGSPGSMSGAPGDNTCVQCHSTFGLNTGTALVSIISTIPASGYVPGNTYTITASAAQTGISKYGFEVHEALGSILITNPTTTQHVGFGSNRITHEAAGTTVIINNISWSFDWVAPVTGSGNATFYGAFVAANNATGNNNDHVYTTNLMVSEFLPVPGCMDALACNYNALATTDDGSCLYSTTNSITATICTGDSVLVGNSVYTVAGTYTDVLTAANSCDSIITTVLDFYQSLALNIGSAPNPAEICLGGTILLEASPGFVSYAWTNGMTGQIISDNPTTDTWYMVEAVDANGCVVKEDISVYVDSCITGVNETYESNKELLKITDILGRESKPTPNASFFYRYNDGTVEKRIIVE